MYVFKMTLIKILFVLGWFFIKIDFNDTLKKYACSNNIF